MRPLKPRLGGEPARASRDLGSVPVPVVSASTCRIPMPAAPRLALGPPPERIVPTSPRRTMAAPPARIEPLVPRLPVKHDAAMAPPPRPRLVHSNTLEVPTVPSPSLLRSPRPTVAPPRPRPPTADVVRVEPPRPRVLSLSERAPSPVRPAALLPPLPAVVRPTPPPALRGKPVSITPVRVPQVLATPCRAPVAEPRGLRFVAPPRRISAAPRDNPAQLSATVVIVEALSSRPDAENRP